MYFIDILTFIQIYVDNLVSWENHLCKYRFFSSSKKKKKSKFSAISEERQTGYSFSL